MGPKQEPSLPCKSLYKNLAPLHQLPQSTPDYRVTEEPKKEKAEIPPVMSIRGSRASRITEDEINELIRKLQAVIPETHRAGRTKRASAAKILEDTCNYIKSLHREVEELSERLSALMSSMDTDSAEGELMKNLLVQIMRGSER